jgi:hypothetical protein
MATVAGDLGHKGIKLRSEDSPVKEVVYPHALVQLDETEFRQIQQRHADGILPDGYVTVNEIPYVFGEYAEVRNDFIPRKGARRYTSDYYGVMAAIGFALLFNSDREIRYFGSYPSELVNYRDELMRSVLGAWNICIGDRGLTFRVISADSMDEPICGLMNVVLTADGKRYQRSEIYDGSTLVIDVGGGTTDIQGVNPYGEPDYSMTKTITLGVNKIVDDFKRAFVLNNKVDFSSLDSLTPAKVAQAIRDSVYRGGGRKYPCETEVKAASAALVRNVKDFYENDAGGPTRWDHILLTGGGSALLETRLRHILKHDSVVLAEDLEHMHLANVRGALKLAKFYEADGE